MAKKRKRQIFRLSGKVPLPVIIGVIVAIIAIVGYFLYSQGKLASIVPGLPGLAPRATEADFAFIEDATVRKHMVAQANQLTYRTKTYSDAADLNFVSEVQIKGEDFNTRDIESTPDGKETKHKIQLGNTTYVKDVSDNKWWKQTLEPEDLPEEDGQEDAGPIDYKEEYFKPTLKFKALGKEACGNLTCFKYEQSDPGLGGTFRTLWFDDKEYLLRKEKSTVAEFSVEVTYSYDNINIIAPSPTKDVPTGKSIYDYYYGVGADYTAPTNTQDFSPEDFNFDSYSPPTEDQIGY